jgi:uncharacterized protein YegL
MRIIEAFIACTLILLCHYFLSSSINIVSEENDLELHSLARNLMEVMGSEGNLKIIVMGEFSSEILSELIKTTLPPGILYNVSIYSLTSGEILGNASNISGEEYLGRSSITLEGIYTFSYPIVIEKKIPIDVVLVIDRSGSMNDRIPGDEYSKLYYAKGAATTFIDCLNASRDRVGLVSFSTTSNVEVELTFDYDFVKLKIENLAASGLTNIGDGIADATALFDGGRADAIWAMILLSDGKANRPIDEEYAREYALNQSMIAKEKGIRIYTIGLGAKEDLDEALLKEIQTDGYYYSPSAEDLEAIYKAIAQDLIYEVEHDIVVIQVTLVKP